MDIDTVIQSSQQSVARLMSFYCSLDWRVRTLVVAVKHWAKARRMCGAMSNCPNTIGFVLLSATRRRCTRSTRPRCGKSARSSTRRR